ncbi:MAG: hypothetical protein GWP06_17700, partial [Actinobacteria bacterium]|nr:hypothetical protein [Actinomycetota bacterium]
LSVDLRDCTLMGYKVFGVIVEKETVKDIQYTTSGDVKAYVQFQQDMPEGFHRLSFWPTDLFDNLMPPSPRQPSKLLDEQLVQRDLCEVTPFIWEGRLCLLQVIRPGKGGEKKDYYLVLKDAETGDELARCAEGYGLASLLVHDGEIYIFASRWENNTWNDVTLFHSADLINWTSKLVIKGENEGLFNSSVCETPDGFVMAYESDDRTYPAFTTKFARSDDLKNWTKLPQATFGTNRYTACPTIRYANGWYYVLYLERRAPRWWFETYITRSRDLLHWELSAANPVLRPDGLDEGVNASDADLIEVNGNTFVYYCVGDQRTWANVKRSRYPGSMVDFFESWYQTPGIPDVGAIGYGKDD